MIPLFSDKDYIIVTTPNVNDLLLKLCFNSFAPFFFRTVHNYYFSLESLELLGKDAGLILVHKFYYHDFGSENTLYWLRNAKPMGNTKLVGIDGFMNKNWRLQLARTGQTNKIGIMFKKTKAE